MVSPAPPATQSASSNSLSPDPQQGLPPILTSEVQREGDEAGETGHAQQAAETGQQEAVLVRPLPGLAPPRLLLHPRPPPAPRPAP